MPYSQPSTDRFGKSVVPYGHAQVQRLPDIDGGLGIQFGAKERPIGQTALLGIKANVGPLGVVVPLAEMDQLGVGVVVAYV